MKYASLALGTIEAVFNKLGGLEGAEAFLRGETEVVERVCSWRKDEKGWIRFAVTSNGWTGPQWADWFKANGCDLGQQAEFMLRSAAFQPSKMGTVYEVVVLPGELFADEDRYTAKIRERAGAEKLSTPNAELCCLIRRMFSDEEIKAMGLWWIITMHEPISVSDGCPDLLGADRCGRRLRAFYDGPGVRWYAGDGFAFVVSPSI